MSTSGCGLQPRPGPWAIRDRLPSGLVVIGRAEYYRISQALPYQQRSVRRVVTEAEANAIIDDDRRHWPAPRMPRDVTNTR